MAESDDALGYDYQTPVVCGNCETPKDVKSFCLNCDANLCEQCKAQLIHRKHTMLPRTHPKVVAARMSMKFQCKQHPGENYVTYCITCQKPCCPTCIPKSHDKHEFSELSVAAKDIRERLSTYTTKLDTEILVNRTKARDTIEKRLANTKTDAEKHKKIVRQKCQSLRKRIDDMETYLLTQIDKILKEDTTQLEKQLTYIKANEERIRRQLASSNEAMTNSSDIELLITYHDFPDVASFHIPKIVYPGEVDFIESTLAFPIGDKIIGRIIRKSDVTSTVDAKEDGPVGDVNQRPRVSMSKRNLLGPEIAKLLRIGTRVRRGLHWNYPGNIVMSFLVLFHSYQHIESFDQNIRIMYNLERLLSFLLHESDKESLNIRND